MKQGYVKGTDTLITGTLERLSGRANITGFDEDGSVIYEGYTEVFWDDQRTVQRKGGDVYLDEDGEERTLDEIEFRDDGEDDDE